MAHLEARSQFFHLGSEAGPRISHQARSFALPLISPPVSASNIVLCSLRHFPHDGRRVLAVIVVGTMDALRERFRSGCLSVAKSFTTIHVYRKDYPTPLV